METKTQASETKLSMKRTFPVSCDRVFQAWTEPKVLSKWFHVGPDWTTPVHQVDLRVGGKYRFGMLEPGKEAPHIVTGVFREIEKNEKLVFTWKWEGADEAESLVTLLFRDLGDKTEFELIHERFATSEARDKHAQGWQGCLAQLEAMLA